MSLWTWPLAFDVAEIRTARRLVRAATQVGAAQTGSDLDVDGAELVVSELVTNAILHGTAPIELSVDTDEGHCLRIAVSDGDPSPLADPGPPALHQTGGRGLWIIGAVARQWGWTPTSHGKQVWCELGPRGDDRAK
jgi:anti-sigma regulatory factor (Ser/Thr protein kinase)